MTVVVVAFCISVVVVAFFVSLIFYRFMTTQSKDNFSIVGVAVVTVVVVYSHTHTLTYSFSFTFSYIISSMLFIYLVTNLSCHVMSNTQTNAYSETCMFLLLWQNLYSKIALLIFVVHFFAI